MSLCRLAPSESMQQIIDSHLTEEAFAEASASYGKSKEKFLVPTKGTSSSCTILPPADSSGNGSTSGTQTPSGGGGTPVVNPGGRTGTGTGTTEEGGPSYGDD